MDNPLASRRANAPGMKRDDPMLAHARLWQHMHAQPDDMLRQHIETLDYGLPIMGALAANPNVTAKDVIKATANAVAEQKVAPSAGVALISEIPADPDKLQGWLRERYAMNLTAAVHAKAALMSRQQGAQPGQASPGAPMAGSAPQGQPAAPPGGATSMPSMPAPGGPGP